MIRAGQRLQEARLQKKLTLEQASKAIKIKEEFLLAIEKGEYHKLPSRTYAYGFVRNYTDYLGLSKKEILPLFRREFNEEQVFTVLPEGLANPSDFPMQQRGFQRNRFLVVGVILVFVAYILFQYRFAFVSPPLDVVSPKEGQIIVSDMVEIKGKTDPNATIAIDDVPVSIDKEGEFAKKIDIFSGKTTITVRAINRFGRETVIKRSIEAKSPE